MIFCISFFQGRKKITPRSYGKDEFNEGNYTLIKEANRDVAYGYGIAAVLSFRQSSFSSSQIEITGSTNKESLLLTWFFAWAE